MKKKRRAMTELIFARVAPDVKAALVAAAEADGRTLSNYIAVLLAAAIKRGKK